MHGAYLSSPHLLFGEEDVLLYPRIVLPELQFLRHGARVLFLHVEETGPCHAYQLDEHGRAFLGFVSHPRMPDQTVDVRFPFCPLAPVSSLLGGTVHGPSIPVHPYGLWMGSGCN
eukprot:scaffold1518_cov331-Pavlova_lutheri.AAC.1